jgi:predicted Zn-dependent protease
MAYKAAYYDGMHAISNEVSVTLTAIGVYFSSENLQNNWDYGDIIISERPEHMRPLTLTHGKQHAARLVIEDSSLYTLLKRRLPKNQTPRISIAIDIPSLLAWSAAAAVLLWGLYMFAPIFTSYVAKNLPPSWEEEIGKRTVQVLTYDKQVCDSPKCDQALKAITDRLSPSLPEDLNYSVQIVRDGEMNAFAAPGGRIIVFSGLIEKAGTPEELAAVIAHELGHVVERHPIQGFVHALGFGLLAGFIMGDGGSVSAAAISNGLLQLHYSRELEERADRLAIEYLQRANIGTHGLVAFFERLQKKNPANDNRIFDYISTHPSTADRI